MNAQPTTPRTQSGREPEDSRLRDRPAIRDVLYTFVFMFVAGALVAIVYRFPVPFGGQVSGLSGAWEAILATLVYGLAGGFLVVPLLAAGAGTLLRARGFPGHGPAAAFPPFAIALLCAVALTLIMV